MTDRPNLLFIMADQFRHDYFGAAGNDAIRTPHLDGLASRGVRFTQCSTTSPICAPARISLASGLLPHRLGALDNQAFLPNHTPTYYQRLRDYGYHVGCVGKLDLAKPDKFNGLRGDRPRAFAWGFTHPVECEGKMHAGSSKTPIGPYTKFLSDRGLLTQFHQDYRQRSAKGWIAKSEDSVLPTDSFEDVFIGDRACAWVQERLGDFPWHLFVSFAGPHDPFDPPKEYADRYREAPMPPAIQDDYAGKPEWIRLRDLGLTEEQVALTRRQYSAAISVIDNQIGRIVSFLEHRKLIDNTYIVFASDHGEMLGDHGLYTKHCAYEASMRVPLLVAGPDIAAGRTSNALVELMDVNPTLCDLAGVPPLERIDARSFAPVVRGEAGEHRPETVTAETNYRAIRTRTHKFIENHNDVNELYDLAADPDELHNIEPEKGDVARELAAQMRSRFMEGEARR